MGRGTVTAEREVKLSADMDFELPDLRRFGFGTVKLPEQILSTSYYDTKDLRLWHRGITVRHRVELGNHSGTWTLKLPGGAGGRTLDRTELSWPGTRGEIPPEVAQLLRGIVRRAMLEEVLVLRATRQRLVVRIVDALLGEIDDDVVTVVSGGRTGLTFRQIEFELSEQDSDPDPADVESIVDALQQAGARIDREQKFALSLGVDGERQGRRFAKLGPRSAVGTVLQQALTSGLERVLDHDVRLRLHPDEPSKRSVHQARVGVRRLRSDLKTFSPLLDPVWLDHTRSELKWLGSVLGRVRDLDVLAERLEADAAATPLEARGREQLLSGLTVERRKQSNQLADVLGSKRYIDLLDRLHAGAGSPPFHVTEHEKKPDRSRLEPDAPARRAVPELVRPHWKRLRKKVRRAGPRPTDAELHRIRIGSKQLRYATESAEPVIGKTARRTAHRAEDLQVTLGEQHDSVGAVEWLERAAIDGTPATSFAAGVIAADARRQQAELRSQWEHEWDALRSKHVTHWLR
jgi:CHAD domain-containing protein